MMLPGDDDSPFDAGRVPCPRGGEDCWSARWLMEHMGYDKWQNFEQVIERAKQSAHNEGFNVRTLFTAVSKKGEGRPQLDYMLTRFAAYLVAMNGHPGKPEVAAAQTYFAVKTRQAETAAPAMTDDELIHRALTISARRVEELQIVVAEQATQLEADAPKVAAYERFIDSDGTYSVGTVAKLIGLSQNKLFQRLRGCGVLIAKGHMQNTPYQRYMHHFTVKAAHFERKDGTAGTSYTTRVLPSGVKFIAGRLGLMIRDELDDEAGS